MKNFLIKNGWWLIAISAFVFLIAHTVGIEFIKVDNTTIALLALILASPFITAITKIKIGDFEAEIGSKEVAKIKETISSEIEVPENYQNLPRIEKKINSIQSLVDKDPILALAKLRIELEKTAYDVYKIVFYNRRSEKQPPLAKIIRELQKAEALNPEVANLFFEVVSVCNRAMHGIEIKQQDAVSITESGSTLLWNLASFTGDDEYLLDPLKTEIIDQDTLHTFMNAKYQVTTVTPAIENPEKNIRILNQEELDELLDGYEEYAEFLVDIRIISEQVNSGDGKGRGGADAASLLARA